MIDFQGIAADMARANPELQPCLPAIEKELLHFEILAAMQRAGHLKGLMFKGGICLRLCHGALRFSEDLDFSGGESFVPAALDDLGDVLKGAIGRRYGLDVTVSPPNRAGRKVKRWLARVVTRPSPTTARLGVQRIKIEIDDREPAPTAAVLPMFRHHDRLAGNHAGLLVRCAPLRDICSDKLVAFPMSVANRQNPRHRDVWDVLWILRRPFARRSLNVEGILRTARSKAASWGLGAEYAEACAHAAGQVDAIVNSDAFGGTLRRFLPAGTFEQTVGNADYRNYMAAEMADLLARIRDGDSV